MKHLLVLCVFPLLAILFCLIALALKGDDVSLRWRGSRAPAMVSGMLIVRPGRVDLVDSITTRLVIEMSDGRRIHAAYRNNRPVWTDSSKVATAPTLGDAAQSVDPRLETLLTEAARGDVPVLRWLLQREARRATSTTHVVRIEKTEQATGLFNLDAVPAAIVVTPEGLQASNESPSMTSPAGLAGDVTTFAVFDTRDSPAMRNRNGDTLVQYEQQRLGSIAEPATKDFFLFSEPYATEFRPIFTYTSGSRQYVGISDVGRHGGPTLALRLFEPCWAFHDDGRPEVATVAANAGPINGDVLSWLSRFCEGLFGQWGMPLLVGFAASMFGLVGALLISLQLWPAKRSVALGPPLVVD